MFKLAILIKHDFNPDYFQTLSYCPPKQHQDGINFPSAGPEKPLFAVQSVPYTSLQQCASKKQKNESQATSTWFKNHQTTTQKTVSTSKPHSKSETDCRKITWSLNAKQQPILNYFETLPKTTTIKNFYTKERKLWKYVDFSSRCNPVIQIHRLMLK